MNKISFSHFSKLLTSQPFFVWNDLSLEEQEYDDTLLKFDLPSFVDPIKTSFSQVQAKTFSKLNNIFIEKLDRINKNSLIISGTLEEKIELTKRALLNKEVDLIIGPVFNFNYLDHDAIAMPAYYCKSTKKLSFVKFSTSTKLNDFLKIWFDYQVIQKNNIPVNDVSLNILATKEYEKRGQIDFFETRFINTSKTARSNKSAKDDLRFLDMQMSKAGLAFKADGTHYEKLSLIELLRSPSISIRRKKYFFDSLEVYLSKIIDCKDSEKPTSAMKEDVSDFWNSNRHWSELLKYIDHPLKSFSGNLVPKKLIVENTSIDELKLISSTFKKIIENDHVEIFEKDFVNRLVNRINSSKIVWYDFEAFSLPFSPMKLFLPFQQVVFQVSIITTINLGDEKTNNIVIDPLKITYEDFIFIIDSLFSKDSLYVVYNKSYENTRLLEMVKALKIIDHPQAEEMSQKVEKIIENTIDLADLFICSKNKLPKILVPDLQGKHSIKLLEKYIFKNDQDSLIKSGAKQYSNLNIQNGMQAMEAANNRALEITGDNSWLEIQEKLKEYCENDVRSMIMLYHFIEKIAKT